MMDELPSDDSDDDFDALQKRRKRKDTAPPRKIQVINDNFVFFFDDEVKLTILNERIRYAHQYMESNKDYRDCHRVHAWVKQPMVI